MSHTLLVYKVLTREAFLYEHYACKYNVFALVEKGSFSVNCAGEEHTVGEGEAVCFHEGHSYHRKVLSPVRLHLFRYPSTVQPFPPGRICFRDKERIRSTIRLLNLCEEQSLFEELSCRQALFDDLVNLYRIENGTDSAHMNGDPEIARAISYIKENLHKKIDLKKPAEESFLSYVQFSRRFKKATGVTAQEYVSRMRLQKAKALLSDSNLSIKEIAAWCGFANEYYFSNFFRKHLSLSPSGYRHLLQSTERL